MGHEHESQGKIHMCDSIIKSSDQRSLFELSFTSELDNGSRQAHLPDLTWCLA